MIQLSILSGKMAGDVKIVRHFPFNIGRAGENELCLNEPGVWDHHLMLEFVKGEGFVLSSAPDAFTAVNEQPQSSATRLRNGDIISFGPVKIQFWLAPARLRGLRLRELTVWVLLAGVTIMQAALIYLLVK